jgi:F-type H+-transporting ATPase subunit a
VVGEAKFDPMHQFQVHPIVPLHIGGYDISLTNSALWMLIALGVIVSFISLGMKRELVPGRWQMAVEQLTGMIDQMAGATIGPEGKKFAPLLFSLFTFILIANFLGILPFAVVPGLHPFASTSHFSVTGVLAVISFSIVLIVGFTKHGLHFFSLFLPAGVPWYMQLFLFPIELISFLVRPFSLGLRLFVAIFAGHVLMEVFGNFIVNGFNGGALGIGVGLLSLLFVVFIGLLEILVCLIQAYVFTLLTAVYLNEAVNLH